MLVDNGVGQSLCTVLFRA